MIQTGSVFMLERAAQLFKDPFPIMKALIRYKKAGVERGGGLPVIILASVCNDIWTAGKENKKEIEHYKSTPLPTSPSALPGIQSEGGL